MAQEDFQSSTSILEADREVRGERSHHHSTISDAMALKLYDADVVAQLEEIEELIGFGVFPDPADQRVSDGGAFLTFCSDGRRFPDAIKDLVEIWNRDGKKRLIQPVPRFGGALRLLPGSPVNEKFDHHVSYAKELLEAIELFNDLHTVLVGVHFPCGMAAKHGMKVMDILEGAVEAKNVVKRLAPNYTIAVIFGVDWSGHPDPKRQKRGKILYRLSGSNWNAWRRKHGRSLQEVGTDTIVGMRVPANLLSEKGNGNGNGTHSVASATAEGPTEVVGGSYVPDDFAKWSERRRATL